MKRHMFDPLSFIFGLAFVALAGALSSGGIDGLQLDVAGLRWVGAAILLVIGAVMLIGTRTDSNRDHS